MPPKTTRKPHKPRPAQSTTESLAFARTPFRITYPNRSLLSVGIARNPNSRATLVQLSCACRTTLVNFRSRGLKIQQAPPSRTTIASRQAPDNTKQTMRSGTQLLVTCTRLCATLNSTNVQASRTWVLSVCWPRRYRQPPHKRA